MNLDPFGSLHILASAAPISHTLMGAMHLYNVI